MHVPQLRRLPQPSPAGPQVRPRPAHVFGVHVPPPPEPHLLGPPAPQLCVGLHDPQATNPPQPSAIGPHPTLFALQSATVRGVQPVLPPQMLGFPPPPHVCGAVHEPHVTRPPHPSASGPHDPEGKSSHVFGVHDV